MLGMFEVAHTNDESVRARAPVTLADKPLRQRAAASVKRELEELGKESANAVHRN